jgi:DNA-binding GntR family transcriptional regulator
LSIPVSRLKHFFLGGWNVARPSTKAQAKSRAGSAPQGARSLAEAAYETIEEMIVTCALKPGAMISESHLCGELAMGRTPIREALARLRQIGFVEVHHRRGVLVSRVDVIRHLELLEVRRPLEEAVVRRAVVRAKQNDLDELRDIARDLEAAAKRGDRGGYFRLKRRIHEIEVRAAHNPVLSETMQALHAQSRRFWYTYEPTESFTHGARLHAAIARHVYRRDAKGAAKAVAALFEFLERLTRAALERRPLV